MYDVIEKIKHDVLAIIDKAMRENEENRACSRNVSQKSAYVNRCIGLSEARHRIEGFLNNKECEALIKKNSDDCSYDLEKRISKLEVQVYKLEKQISEGKKQ